MVVFTRMKPHTEVTSSVHLKGLHQIRWSTTHLLETTSHCPIAKKKTCTFHWLLSYQRWGPRRMQRLSHSWANGRQMLHLLHGELAHLHLHLDRYIPIHFCLCSWNGIHQLLMVMLLNHGCIELDLSQFAKGLTQNVERKLVHALIHGFVLA